MPAEGYENTSLESSALADLRIVAAKLGKFYSRKVTLSEALKFACYSIDREILEQSVSREMLDYTLNKSQAKELPVTVNRDKCLSADVAIRLCTIFSVSVVSLIAAIISYSHIYRVALKHGQTIFDARLLPFSVDGLIAAGSLVLFYASRNHLRSPILARIMLGLGVGATIAVNCLYGLTFGVLGSLISAWPAVAFIGAAELTIYMIHETATIRTKSKLAAKANKRNSITVGLPMVGNEYRSPNGHNNREKIR